MSEATAYEVEVPGGPPGAAALVAELQRRGIPAETVAAEAGVISVDVASTVVLTAVAGFARNVLGMGLTLDLASTPPRVSATAALAPGSLRTVPPGGTESLRQALGDQQIGYLLRAGLAMTGR